MSSTVAAMWIILVLVIIRESSTCNSIASFLHFNNYCNSHIWCQSKKKKVPNIFIETLNNFNELTIQDYPSLVLNTVNTDLLAMFHSRAGFWELLSLSTDTPPLIPSFSGLSCSHWAVPMLMDWRSSWYWRSSTSEPGSRRMPRFSACLGERDGKDQSVESNHAMCLWF